MMYSRKKCVAHETIRRPMKELLQIFRTPTDLPHHSKATTASEKRKREVKNEAE